MKHSNVSIFIPHNGCPHQCSFCNQKSITGQSFQPDGEYVTRVIKKAQSDLKENAQNAEIAFFGGSFTAIDREYMLSLLKAAQPFLQSFAGIRISTRPDYIDGEILSILKAYGVTSIELGAQSMDDEVLLKNERGHSSDDVRKSAGLIKEYGFSLGLQMMTGLYFSTPDKDRYTAEEFIKLKPDTVRIYPTVIMKDTPLARLYLSGEYTPYTLSQSVNLCAELINRFESENIKIIRLGLHYSDSLKNNSLADNYHPAFKELCENKIFLDNFLKRAEKTGRKTGFTVYINPKSLSKFLGQKKKNLTLLRSMGYEFKLGFDNTLSKYGLYISD